MAKKNVLQMKEKGKKLQDLINEEEIGNLSEKEFRVMIKKFQNIENKMEKMQERFYIFNKGLEDIKNKQG